MGMSTHVKGFRPPDDTWVQMKAIWDACESAGVEVPQKVCDFFNGETPDDTGMEIDIDVASSEWRDEYREGIEIDLSKLPKGLKVIRFYNSY